MNSEPHGRTLFVNARLVLPPPEGIRHAGLLAERGLITAIGDGIDAGDARVIDLGGDLLLPGLIDLHLHGAGGHDVMEATGESFETILRHHAAEGTTTALLTTVASSLNRMLAVLGLAERWQDGEDRPIARLAGIHLEGPWFSLLRRGAHDPAMIRRPHPAEVQALVGHVAMIRRLTMAPELPGAADAVRMLTGAGITVSAGHSNATEEEALEGFRAGITQVTHLHNAMSSLRKTSPPRRGLAEVALETPGVLCEVIADGYHVRDELLREAVAAKGWEGIALVSDATAGAGLSEGSLFSLGGLECRVEGGAAKTAGGVLAGSTRFLREGIWKMAAAGVPLSEAVAMASLVPARALGLAAEIGSLGVGKRADLIRCSEEGAIRNVWIRGKEVGDRE